MAESIVRQNLMKRPGYTPYCGADNCRWLWPRTEFDGEQFKCACGWRSSFESEFIERYNAKRTGDHLPQLQGAGAGETGASAESVPGGDQDGSLPAAGDGAKGDEMMIGYSAEGDKVYVTQHERERELFLTVHPTDTGLTLTIEEQATNLAEMLNELTS